MDCSDKQTKRVYEFLLCVLLQWNNIKSQEDQRKQSTTETVMLRERERQLQRELSQARDLLSREQQHSKELVNKVSLRPHSQQSLPIF